MSSVRGIILDLGKVLVDFDHTIAARRIGPYAGKTPQEIFSLFFSSDLTGRFEAGKIGPEEFFAQVRQLLSLDMEYEAFLPIWNEIFFLSDHNRQVYALAQRLRGRYPLALLSNVNILHFQYLRQHFPVFDVFDHLLTSYEMGAVKPDPVLYLRAVEILRCAPPEVFYADDRPELVERAAALGIRAFVYAGPQRLREDLVSCGVLLE